VRFGDVVENCNETCDPADAGLERFVAMEHLEPGSLHVRSWGNVADGTTFTRRCRPGQVLFGKRRAYQRKVAVAEFEAVVSGDIYVLAPKDSQRLLPELLPFLCLSERFFQHAVGTSAGSLSPRTNWSSLASFEFDLPPLDQQRRIAEILWAVDEQQQANLAVVEALNELNQAKKSKWLDVDSLSYPRKSLTEICDPTQWQTISQRDLEESGVPVFGANGYIGFYHTANHQSDTIAITCRGSTCGTVNWIPGPSYITGNSMCLENLIGELDQRYLFEILQHLNMRAVITGSAQPQITRASLASLRVPLPPMKVQRAWVFELATLRSATEQATTYANNTAQLSRAMNERLTAP
jgi:type I restriction enzyme S subunit